MTDFLSKTLHKDISATEYKDMQKLPLMYRNLFTLYMVRIDGSEFILAAPNEEIGLVELRKAHKQLERYTKKNCAYLLQGISYYARDKMIEEGIPFVWDNHQVYLPFIGVLLDKNEDRHIADCDMISFLTQKLMLKALYEQWSAVTVTEAAERMGVSKMSITRCYDEIQSFGLPFLQTKSRARKLYADEDKKEMWVQMRPYLRNPIISMFRLGEDIDAAGIFGGISALAQYSLISENPYPIYAVEKSNIAGMEIKKKPMVPSEEEPVCVVQEVGYILPFEGKNAVDPLSLTLMLTPEEMSDPRIEKSVKEMLEEYVW